jgi:hypothetical protein
VASLGWHRAMKLRRASSRRSCSTASWGRW